METVESDAVKIRVGERLFTSSKSLLSRQSDYFKAMFSKNFQEGRESEVCIDQVDEASFQTILDWSNTGSLDLQGRSPAVLCNLLSAASMLLLPGVSEACQRVLAASLEHHNCLRIFQVADSLSLVDLANQAKRLCVWRYSSCQWPEDPEFQPGESLAALLLAQDIYVAQDSQLMEDFTRHFPRIPEDRRQMMLRQLFKNQWEIIQRLSSVPVEESILQTLSQKVLNISAILKPLGIDISSKDCSEESWFQILRENNFPVERTSVEAHSGLKTRCWQPYPCVVGFHYPPGESGLDFREKEKRKTVSVFAFSPYSAELTRIFDVDRVVETSGHENTVAVGFRVSPAASVAALIVTGGEFKYGRNNWNIPVWKYCYSSNSWEELTRLEEPRRHHTAVVLGEYIYLLGGFDRKRVMLNSVVRINLNNGKQEECSPLPSPLFKSAATAYQGEIVVIEKQLVHTYSPRLNGWSSKLLESCPQQVEFTAANQTSQGILLTSTYSREIYLLEKDEGRLERVGSFLEEAQNTTSLGDSLYNFHSQEFGDGSSVEVFDARTRTRTTVWEDKQFTDNFASGAAVGAFVFSRG